MARLFPRTSLWALPCLVCLAGSASAVPIAWQPSVQMYPGTTDQGFVDTTGTTVLAINGTTVGADQPGAVNGVTFTNVDPATLTGSGYTENGVTITAIQNNTFGAI